MINVVVIESNGTVTTQSLKKCIFSDLYKKCGFRNNNHFDKRITWKLKHKTKQLCVSVFAKNNGRANTENKYDFPPPIDNDLYFGKVIIIACKDEHKEENVVDIDDKTWYKIYEQLMGGFIDLDNTSGEEEPEEEIPEHLKTKHGYKKDSFVVDDDDEEEEDDDDDDEEEEEEEEETDDENDSEEEHDEEGEMSEDIEEDIDEEEIIHTEPLIKKKTKTKRRRNKKNKSDITVINDDEVFNYEDELQEEEYLSE